MSRLLRSHTVLAMAVSTGRTAWMVALEVVEQNTP
jgi:hypothetical protein